MEAHVVRRVFITAINVDPAARSLVLRHTCPMVEPVLNAAPSSTANKR